MDNPRFMLGMAQLLVVGGEPARNVASAVTNIAYAAREGCSIIVLPECLDTGWAHPSARTLAQPIPGPWSDQLCRAAQTHGVYVVAGLAERDGERLYNAALLISPQGRILWKHRKINLLVEVEGFFDTGGSLGVTHTLLGTIGIDICADNFPNSLVFGHALARMGAQLILAPSAWAVPADYDNAREPYGALWREAFTPLARLYGLTVIGVSNVGWLNAGAWAGYKAIGCSLAIGPGGQELAQGPYGEAAEALIVVPIELQPPTARGTQIADMLTTRGYFGP